MLSSSHFPSQPHFLTLFLLVSAHGVYARECFISDAFGNVVCTGLSTGARIGIAIAIFAVAMIALMGLVYWQRRRVRARNLVYLTNPNVVYTGYDPRGQPYNAYPGYPQYPPQAYAEQSYNGYEPQFTNANTGYNPPYSPYAPPSGPPGTPLVDTKA